MASGFSSRSDEILKDFSISDPTVAVERNASLKNQSSLEENYEKKGKAQKKKKQTKKKRIKKLICITKLAYDDSIQH